MPGDAVVNASIPAVITGRSNRLEPTAVAELGVEHRTIFQGVAAIPSG